MFASTFKRTHWLVPGYCLGQIALRGGMLRGDTLGTYVVDVCSLAKIGVILVSCSCGKWSPIDADVPNRFRPQPLETKCCTLGHNGLVLHIFVLAWNSCIKLVPHQLTVILGLVSTQAVFLGIYIPKIRS